MRVGHNNNIEDAEEWPEPRKLGAVRTLIERRELIASLTYRDIKARYKQSVLGIAWALLTPLAMTVVFTVFASLIGLDSGTDIPYPVFAYAGLLPWEFFSLAIGAGTECLVVNFSLITKIYFPREVFPIAATLGKTVDLGLGILVMVPLFLVFRVKVTPLVLLVPLILLVQICFMLGLSFLFSSANLFYRDIRHVVALLLKVWMYMTPIIYPLEKVPEKFLFVYMLNPMVSILDSFRRVTLYGQEPAWGYLGMAAVVSVLTLIIGYRVFKRLEPAFAETI